MVDATLLQPRLPHELLQAHCMAVGAQRARRHLVVELLPTLHETDQQCLSMVGGTEPGLPHVSCCKRSTPTLSAGTVHEGCKAHLQDGLVVVGLLGDGSHKRWVPRQVQHELGHRHRQLDWIEACADQRV